MTDPTPAERSDGYPATFRPTVLEGRMRQPPVFDPAVQHFSRGFRVGEPRFEDVDLDQRWRLALRWRSARRRAMEHVLRLVTADPFGESLVLRGSVVLGAWLGPAAREPNDLDFICPAPAGVAAAESIVTELAYRVVADPVCGGDGDVVRLDGRDARAVDIWTYDRAPGRRAVFPWSVEGLPGGLVQVDLVAGEPLPVPPVITDIPLADGGTLPVRTAPIDLSLAWKLLWLATDMHPMGKDLYDATLLAEKLVSLGTPWDGALLRSVIAAVEPRAAERCGLSTFGDIAPHEWEHFPAEYPWLDVTLDDLRSRLEAALQPTFASAGTWWKSRAV